MKSPVLLGAIFAARVAGAEPECPQVVNPILDHASVYLQVQGDRTHDYSAVEADNRIGDRLCLRTHLEKLPSMESGLQGTIIHQMNDAFGVYTVFEIGIAEDASSEILEEPTVGSEHPPDREREAEDPLVLTGFLGAYERVSAHCALYESIGFRAQDDLSLVGEIGFRYEF